MSQLLQHLANHRDAFRGGAESTNYHDDDYNYEELDPDLYRDYDDGTWGDHY